MSNAPTNPAHDQQREIVSVSQFVPTAAAQIFDVLATPKMHAVIDGSGSVRAELNGPARLSRGARFGMSMRLGVPYRITNTVVEFDEGRRIAWRHFGGHVWRYLLEPVEGGTLVTEQFDYSTSRAKWYLRMMKSTSTNEVSMRKTLLNLAKHFT
ncbi:MAG: SRPBCC family protein [Actinomycetota bacterium]|jgi:hypothetical protein